MHAQSHHVYVSHKLFLESPPKYFHIHKTSNLSATKPMWIYDFKMGNSKKLLGNIKTAQPQLLVPEHIWKEKDFVRLRYIFVAKRK